MERRRRDWFRVFAVLLGLSLFPLVEGMLRLFVAEPAPHRNHAFAEIAASRPLFERSSDGNRFQIASGRRGFFAEDSFPAAKSADVTRIFVFGGSTVQGRPYSIQTSFTTFLRLALQRAYPERKWEVINCGGVSYASYRLLPIMRECLQYQPDGYLVCTGHNEFLESVTYQSVFRSPPVVRKSWALVQRFRSIQLLSHLFATAQNSNPDARQVEGFTQLSGEVDAALDHRNGLEAYRRSALLRDDVTSRFGEHLQQMVQMCRTHRLPLLLMAPTSNLRHCPPFRSEFTEQLSDEDRERIRDLLSQAGRAAEVPERISLLKQAIDGDPQFAFSWYQLGHACLETGDIERAREAFQTALDEDVCPLRMLSSLRSTMHDVAAESETPLVDLQQVFTAHSRSGIVGDDLLVDHIHPSFGGHQMIAMLLVSKVSNLLTLPPAVPDWESAAKKDFSQHLQSLDSLYFLRGQRTLENLKAWAAGRADGPPLKIQRD
ncbi:MAG: tetratricopeptide repeat protein [Planctomycetaceae bacterium]